MTFSLLCTLQGDPDWQQALEEANAEARIQELLERER